jgi:branched-chain amino acid transport system substrate-binding protein
MRHHIALCEMTTDGELLGEPLSEVAAMLPYYDVNRSQVQILGPMLWASPAGGSGQLPGAWYAAPDPAARAGLEQSYAAKYRAPPVVVADLAFDAASIARVLGAGGGYSVGALTQPAGFMGVAGWRCCRMAKCDGA